MAMGEDVVAETYEEDALLPISALQHFLFCERRAALIYTERLWGENEFTARDQVEHERVHQVGSEGRGDILITRGLHVRSLHLGLTGHADVVEYHRCRQTSSRIGIPLDCREGAWQPLPVEYKSGRKRHEVGYEVQLCAQALCLEEMLNVAVPQGALYYAASQRRIEISFTCALREATRVCATRLHQVLESGKTPAPTPGPRRGFCSLIGQCLPATANHRSALRYVAEAASPDEGGKQ
jgi:CRISPR-associated exonuclease Cas4